MPTQNVQETDNRRSHSGRAAWLWVLLAIISVSLLATGRTSPAKEPDGKKPKHTNALAKETSPYLLMHAHNPVNWYAWNEESLSLAKKENKPIFLSVGYSCLLYTSPSPRDATLSRMPSSA